MNCTLTTHFDLAYSFMKKFVFLTALLLIFSTGSATAAPEVGEAVPALKGKLFSGEPFDLSQMRGKVVLVNFYSSYCSFCAYEIGNL